MRDLLLCLFSSFNLILFTFIGLNYEAFRTVLTYEVPSPQQQLNMVVPSNPMPAPKVLSKSSQNPQQKTAWEGQLVIPKIQLSIPLSWRRNASSADIQTRLQQGAVSFSPLNPSAKNERSIIFAHSSDYAWNDNPYRSAFALLPQLEPGDSINILKDQRLYEYQVISSSITEPDLAELTSTPPSQHELILSTCYPIGFFSKRFNIIATPLRLETQVSPDRKPSPKTLSKPKRT